AASNTLAGSTAPRPPDSLEMRSMASVAGGPCWYSGAYDCDTSVRTCVTTAPPDDRTSAPTAYVPAGPTGTSPANVVADVRSRGTSRAVRSGVTTRPVAVAPSGKAAADSTVTRRRSPSIWARADAPPAPVPACVNVSFTTPDQNDTYPGHAAQFFDHRAEASLVHAVARPRPTCQLASKGSS